VSAGGADPRPVVSLVSLSVPLLFPNYNTGTCSPGMSRVRRSHGSALRLGVELMLFERATQYPTTEEHIHDTPVPRSAYGLSKPTGEVYVRATHDEHGLPFTLCRPFNAYGPGEMPEDEPGIDHMVPDVIKKCLTLEPGAPLPIFGDGTQTRTLMHIDDNADGIVAAMVWPAGLDEDFNVSASDECTVAELAQIIWEACGLDPGESRSSTFQPSRSTSCAAGRASRRRSACSAGRHGSDRTRESQTVQRLRPEVSGHTGALSE